MSNTHMSQGIYCHLITKREFYLVLIMCSQSFYVYFSDPQCQQSELFFPEIHSGSIVHIRGGLGTHT